MATTSTILERNLAALAVCAPRAADLVRRAPPHPGVVFSPTDDGALTASLDGRQLASRRRPLEEADRLAGTVSVERSSCIVVLGFGLGYHVGALARRMRRTGVIVVLETDVPLLRAVLERVDCSDWVRGCNIVIVTDASDTGALSDALRGAEALLFLSSTAPFLEHPPSAPRLGDGAAQFRACFAEVVLSSRSTIATTLVQSEITHRNLLMNLDRYATVPGVADLAGAGAGRPAIVVSAGPSLRRNIDLLSRPGVADRFVIIAVQTVLKTLLAKGIRPHFVCALDHHEISARFYEGLTADGVRGVTLVAQPHANPAILASFPGPVRCTQDRVLDELLGKVVERPGGPAAPELLPESDHEGRVLAWGLARPMGKLTPGATVAHLAYHLARHLGCDPVILIGQDLGFTDGQYYAAGAAIHQVWSGELNPFNTLEMMEWERIARVKRTLRTAADQSGRRIYTDLQMESYRVQFEREFLADAQRGLTVIDATEGGVTKLHTLPMMLSEAIVRYQPGAPLALPSPPEPLGADRLAKVAARVRAVRQEVWQVGELSRQTGTLLEEIGRKLLDQQQVNRLIARVYENRDRVQKLLPAFSLVQQLNQLGVLKRARADREISLDESLTPQDRQRRQLERDIVNVGLLADAGDLLGSMLDDSLSVLGGGPRTTRDPPPPLEDGAAADRGPRRVGALIDVDAEHGSLGWRRDLAEPFLAGHNPLRLALLRLAGCRKLDGVVLLTRDEAAARHLAGPRIPGLEVTTVLAEPHPARRAASIRAARQWATGCWRGGIGSLTVYDEIARPAEMARVMAERRIDAAVLIGADWALVDPAIIDETIERYRERPGAHRFTFSQAAPGLGAAVVERTLLEDMAAKEDQIGVFATFAGLLGYVPAAPQPDPIARPTCAPVDPAVRDAQARFIPDSPGRRAQLIAALGALGDAVVSTDAATIARVVAEHALGAPAPWPRQLTLELCTGRLSSGPRAGWLWGSVEPGERQPLAPSLADRLFCELGEAMPDGAVTLGGAGDPLLHPECPRIVELARRAGLAVHVRTDLLCDRARIDALLDAGPDVISVDLMADSAAVYRAVMGADLFDTARANLEHLLNRQGPGLPRTWIVPRLTRCDAVYEEIETFFDRWVMAAGAAVIDPLPGTCHGERIEPLPIPGAAARRLWREHMLILCDGRAPFGLRDYAPERSAGDVGRESLPAVWRRIAAHRHRLARDNPAHADLAV